jgi:hypothetical protein
MVRLLQAEVGVCRTVVSSASAQVLTHVPRWGATVAPTPAMALAQGAHVGGAAAQNGTFRAEPVRNATISDYGRAKKPRSDREPGEIDYGAETRQRGLSFNTVTRS